MKLVKQYVHWVGKYIHNKDKYEILREIETNLMDDIEATCGLDASEKEVFERIEKMGTPRELAKSYTNTKGVIDESYTDIYFMIIKMVALGLGVAFIALYFVEVVIGAGDALAFAINLPLSFLGSYVSAVGVITFIFIGVSRMDEDVDFDLSDDWSLKELKGVELGNEPESKIGSVIALCFLVIFGAVIVYQPEKMLMIEEGFMMVDMIDGYSMNVEVFKLFVPFIAVSILIDIVYHVMALIKGEKTKSMNNLQTIGGLYDVVLFATMLINDDLFRNNGFFVNLRSVFVIIFVISLVELIVSIYKRWTMRKAL